MKLNSRHIIGFFLVAVFLTTGNAYGRDQLKITSLSGGIDDDGTLTVIVEANQDLTIYKATTKLLYRLYGGSIPATSSFQLVAPNPGGASPNQLSFTIAKGLLTTADEIEYFVQINDTSNNTMVESTHYRVDLALQRKLKAEQLKGQQYEITIKDLKDQIAKSDNAVPKAVTLLEDPLISDEQASFHFHTPIAGKIRVEILRDDNSMADFMASPQIQKEHAIVLHKLTGGQHYKVQAWVLDHLKGDVYDKSHPMLTSDQEDRLSFTTPQDVERPRLDIGDITTTDKSIVVPITLDEGFIKLVCEAQTDALRDKYKEVDARGNLAFNPYGKPTGDKMESPYVFSGLIPDTQYRLTFQAVNSKGKALVKPETRIVKTKPKPPDFDFTGSVQLDISPLGFTATWFATSLPKSGSFDVVFGTGGPITSKPATIEGNKLTASLDVTALQQLFSKAKEKNQPKTEDKPTLKFKMQNDQKVDKEASLIVSYTMPTAAQVEEAKQKGIINDNDKRSILSVIQGTTDNSKKFKWQDVMSTGIGLLLKFL